VCVCVCVCVCAVYQRVHASLQKHKIYTCVRTCVCVSTPLILMRACIAKSHLKHVPFSGLIFSAYHMIQLRVIAHIFINIIHHT